MNFERRCWVEVDLDALRHNFHLIRQITKGVKIMAVVKADAYGHGDLAVAALLEREGVDAFAVSNFDEAMRLRRTGIRSDILIFGYTGIENTAALAKYQIIQTVFSFEYAKRLSAQAEACGVNLNVHLKIDTGMGRIGFSAVDDYEQSVAEIKSVCTLPHFTVTGIFTHFAAADSQDPSAQEYTKQQYNRFLRIIEILQQSGFSFPVHHCCNSAATIALPAYHMDYVRPGLILYGQNPSDEITLDGLRPAMCMKAVVSMVKWMEPGRSISYGCTFSTKKRTKIATLTVGYADGYPRIMSNRGIVSIHGKQATVIGRICMDQMMVDVTEVDDVKAGDEAIIFGDGAANTVCEIAAIEGTIPYEVLCDIGRRVRRVYMENGKEIDTINYLQEHEINL